MVCPHVTGKEVEVEEEAHAAPTRSQGGCHLFQVRHIEIQPVPRPHCPLQPDFRKTERKGQRCAPPPAAGTPF